MKYFLILILFMSNNSFGCSVKNDEFVFNYSLDPLSKNISYEISKKDNKEFSYFISGKSKSYSYGFIISGKNNKDLRNTGNITERYKSFYLEEGYYSSSLLDTSGFISLPNNNFNLDSFSTKQRIKETLNYGEFIKNIQKNTLKPVAFNEKKIKFQFRYVLNNDLTECLIFQTDDISYNFGNMFEQLRLLENEKK